MNEDRISKLKRNMIAIGRLLWEKELVTGLNGNISARVDDNTILLTATKTCLGLLHEEDILLMDLNGRVLEDGRVSSEKLLHMEIYQHFRDIQAVIHSHTPYTNAYFLNHDTLQPDIFESRLTLGEVRAVNQETPSVTDPAPVIEALKGNSIMVLKRHGVVSMGKDLFDCFLLIQCLEESVKINAVSRLFKQTMGTGRDVGGFRADDGSSGTAGPPAQETYPLFSDEQMREIAQIVNADETMKELGAKTKMTMDLAVKLNETGKVFSFHFQDGRIADIRHDEEAEFLISAPEKVWRAVFNREIDPFVATTQKKMDLRGDFARISRWYAPCSRIFELWQNVPVSEDAV